METETKPDIDKVIKEIEDKKTQDIIQLVNAIEDALRFPTVLGMKRRLNKALRKTGNM